MTRTLTLDLSEAAFLLVGFVLIGLLLGIAI